MVCVLDITFAIIISAIFVIGNLGNGWIAFVNCTDWAKTRKISLADQLLTALAISRIGHLWVIFICLCVSLSCEDFILYGNYARISYNAWIMSNHISMWFATSLSIFYFLKIASFSNPIFLYLKWQVKKVVSLVLLVALLILFLNMVLINRHFSIWIDEHERNMTNNFMRSNIVLFASLTGLTVTAFTSIPFTVSLTTLLLLMFSLKKHHKKMMLNGKGHRDLSSKAHTKAMQAVIFLLLLYAIFFLSHFMSVWSSHTPKSVTIVFFQAIAVLFPSGHSFMLIFQNKKLGQASLLVLRWLGCKFKDQKT